MIFPYCFIRFIFQQIGDAFPFKIPTFSYSVAAAKVRSRVRAQNPAYFLRSKYIILSFYPFTVCVLPAIEASFFICQFCLHISKNPAGHTFISITSSQAKRFHVSHHKQRIVIKHFFKMRHQPCFIRRISGESASNVVKNSSPVHLYQRCFRHRKRFPLLLPYAILHQKDQVMGCRKLRCTAKAPILFVEITQKLPKRLMHCVDSRLCRHGDSFLRF